MNEKVINKATEYIDSIATKLGVAAEHVYELLIKQAIINGVRDLVMFVVLSVVAFFLGKLTLRASKSFDYDMVAPIIGATAIIALVMAIACLYAGVGELINPEYYAIKEILDVISGD
jgi:hypothetical protein